MESRFPKFACISQLWLHKKIHRRMAWTADIYFPTILVPRRPRSSWSQSGFCRERSLWLTDGHLLTASFHGLSSGECIWKEWASSLVFLLLRTLILLDQGPTLWLSVQFSSVAQSCLTLCNSMNRSMPELPVHHQLLESTQTHVHSNPCPFSHWCHPTISSSVIPFSSCPQSFPASGSFPMSQLFISGVQSIGVSASTSVLPMNTQNWSPLGWTGWISLQSKGLSRAFSNTTVQKHQFFSAQLSLESNSHIHTWPLEKP